MRVTSDILLTNPAVLVLISSHCYLCNGIAGEPPEMFTITYQPPGASSLNDPMFLFRDTAVTIIDTDSEYNVRLKLLKLS